MPIIETIPLGALVRDEDEHPSILEQFKIWKTTYFAASLIIGTSSNSVPYHLIPKSRIPHKAALGCTWRPKFEQWLSDWLQKP